MFNDFLQIPFKLYQNNIQYSIKNSTDISDFLVSSGNLVGLVCELQFSLDLAFLGERCLGILPILVCLHSLV